MHNWSAPDGSDSPQMLLSQIWMYSSILYYLPVQLPVSQVHIRFPDPVLHRYRFLLFPLLRHPSADIRSLQIHARHRIPHIPILCSCLPVHSKPDSEITYRWLLHLYLFLPGCLLCRCYRMHILCLLLFFPLLFLYTEDFYFSADSSVL